MNPADMAPGTEAIVDDNEKYSVIVRRSVAGWTEEMMWKPGHEPVQPSRLKRALAVLRGRA